MNIVLIYGLIAFVIFLVFVRKSLKGRMIDDFMVAVLWSAVLIILALEYCKKLFRKRLKPS